MIQSGRLPIRRPIRRLSPAFREMKVSEGVRRFGRAEPQTDLAALGEQFGHAIPDADASGVSLRQSAHG